jgi:hypothetical protein
MAGCGNSTVVGKWRLMGGSNAILWEFSANGVVLVGDVRGRYKLGHEHRIKIQTPFATAVYQMKISGDRMTLQELGGSKLEFTRIRKRTADLCSGKASVVSSTANSFRVRVFLFMPRLEVLFLCSVPDCVSIDWWRVMKSQRAAELFFVGQIEAQWSN